MTEKQPEKALKPAWWPKRLTEAEYRELDRESGGICLECGELDYEQGCEPDAENYGCGACGLRRVYGAENARMMGAIEVDEPNADRSEAS